jgi:hypothetical protein
MNLENIHKSKIVAGIIIGLLIAIIVLAIFQFGVMVGYKKANFSRNMGDNFQRNFMGEFGENRLGGGPFGGFGGEMDFPGGHGAVGEIVSINLPNIVVTGPDNLEKTVIVDSKTAVRQFREEIKSEDLKTGQFIVVLGNPNDDGAVLAKLIRVVPPPPELINK